MKKSFLFLLVSIMTVFLVAGCADDTTTNNGGTTTDKPFDISLLNGTYEVTYFGTVAINDKQATVSAVSTDCNKLISSELGKKYNVQAEGAAPLGTCANGTRQLGGKITISVDTKTETVTIISKMQMVGPFFTEGFGQLAPDDTYQYTKYETVPFSSITSAGINVNSPVQGVSGRNLTKNTSNPKSTFVITKTGEKTIFVDMVLAEKSVPIYNLLDAPTNVEATKISDTVETLDANSLFVTSDQLTDQKEKDIFSKFTPNIQ